MNADEAADFMDRDHERDLFKRRTAIAIAIFAMLLAITGLGGGNASKEALTANILASDTYAFYQAKNMRQTATQLAADAFDLAIKSQPDLPVAAREAAAAKIAEYRKTTEYYESDPASGEGKKELLARAKGLEETRDHALAQDPYFDYAEALLQIAIVVLSVSIVAEQIWLAFLGGALGTVGALLMLDGFTLAVKIPGLA